MFFAAAQLLVGRIQTGGQHIEGVRQVADLILGEQRRPDAQIAIRCGICRLEDAQDGIGSAPRQPVAAQRHQG